MSAEATPVRVALIGCSGLLGDIIEQAVDAQEDIDVVARLAPLVPDAALPDLDADIVLWNNADETRISQLLDHLSRPCRPRVLATVVDGQRAALWELVPHRTELGAPSPSTLLRTIRHTGALRS